MKSCDFDDLSMNWLSAKHKKLATNAIQPSHRSLLDAISLTKHDLLNRETPETTKSAAMTAWSLEFHYNCEML